MAITAERTINGSAVSSVTIPNPVAGKYSLTVLPDLNAGTTRPRSRSCYPGQGPAAGAPFL